MKYLIFLAAFWSSFTAVAQVKHAEPGVINDDDTGKIYTRYDEPPRPPYSLQQYLAENLHYPDSAQAYSTEGRVVIKFVVLKSGRISNCRVSKSADKYLDAEALRVVRNMPPWKPGKIKGRKVKVWYEQPVAFKLTD